MLEEVLGTIDATTALAGHFLALTLLVRRVTAPWRPKRPPVAFAPVFRETEANARIGPMKLVFVPSVAEVPTCHQTLQEAVVGLWMILTFELLAVVRVEAIWKYHASDGELVPFSVKVPVI